MLDRRLMRFAERANRYVFFHVLLQWVGLLMGAAAVFSLAACLGRVSAETMWRPLAVAAGAAGLRALCGLGAARASFLASAGVKRRLRQALYDKLLAFGPSYTEMFSTAELLQVATEGVDQLEAYFGKYLPQFFFSLLAPPTLFGLLAPVSLPAAGLLLACTPLIPLLIVMIRQMAKKMLGRHWKSYVTLGDIFLESLQGMTALKVYGADGARQARMRAESETFRRSTMRVLRMQLNSIVVMDLIAYGGAALGVLLAALGYANRSLDLPGALTVTLLAAEFFLPLRLLGSYFHIAMNGLSASGRMFQILDAPLPAEGRETPPAGPLTVSLRAVSFSYDPARAALSGVTCTLAPGRLVSLVGPSGSGKSTVAALLSGRRRGYAGQIDVGGVPLRALTRESLMRRVTLVTHEDFVFAGTVADNLRLARPDASDEALTAALRQARMWDFWEDKGGLSAELAARGANLSGGQRQRLCLARALLRDSDVYLFDEATSNVDAESEEAIVAAIRALARTKAVLLISHRLANAAVSDQIHLLERGVITESGTHAALLARGGAYARRWARQAELERYAKGGAAL
ncbi:MAG: ABC transporter ATP-binding protein/permease [Oscillospiraceae bacterium]|jgi:ATP-binding cassette subfamily B protein|nr:ABC transporter ATP-binding protein/permease [Oscillospiraceae bacterium]